MQAFADPVGLLAPAAGQTGQHLQPCRCCRCAQPQLGGRAGQASEQERIGLGLGHAGELGTPAGAQLKAALAPTLAPQRDTGGRELVDVAKDRPLRHLHHLRQRLGRHAASRLQQHQDREQSAGFHRAGLNMTLVVMLREQ